MGNTHAKASVLYSERGYPSRVQLEPSLALINLCCKVNIRKMLKIKTGGNDQLAFQKGNIMNLSHFSNMSLI